MRRNAYRARACQWAPQPDSLGRLLAFFVVAVAASCTEPSPENGPDDPAGPGEPRDAEFSEEIDLCAHDGREETDDGAWDLGEESSSDAGHLPPCRAPIIRWSFGHWDYQKPEPRNEDWEPLTKQEFAWIPSSKSPTYERLQWRHDPHLFVFGENPISPVWAATGEDFSTSLLLVNILDTLEDQRAYFTVLVNHEPVPARWTIWADERGGEFETRDASGIAFDIDSWGKLVDLQIPAETFAEPGVHEISFAMLAGRPNRRYFTVLKRIHVFHGGYEWFEPPCFVDAEPTEPNEDEAPTINHIDVAALKHGLVRVEGQTSVEEVLAPVSVSPREVVELEVSMFNKWGLSPAVPVAAVPTLEGIPIDEPMFYFVRESSAERKVALRKTLLVTMPETPGTYDLNIPVWHGASLPADTPTREPIRVNIAGGASNMIRFEVQEP